MAISFHCESCGKRFDVDEALAGKRGKCKQCGLIFIIPGASSADGRPRSPQRATPSPARRADPPPWDHDPYGFDEPVASPPRAEPDEDFEDVMPRRAAMKPAKARRPSRSGPISIGGLPGWGYLLPGIALVVGLAFYLTQGADATKHAALMAALTVAMVLIVVGSIGCVVVPFRESFLCGVFYVLFPFYQIYYLFSRWDAMEKPFLIAMGGFGMALGLVMFVPGLTKARDDAERAPVKNEQVAAGQPAQVPLPNSDQEPAPERRPALQPNIPPSPRTAPPAAAAPLAAEDAGQVRLDLESPDQPRRKGALARLMRSTPGEDRQEVAKAVEPMLKDSDAFTRSDAAKALAVWGGPENTPALLEGLKDPEFHVRWAALDALKAIKDPESADALADYLMSSNDRGRAVEALKAIGPPAEDAVLRCLEHSDGFTRADACKILEQIGTEKSLPALRRLAGTNRGLDSMAARNALRRLDKGRGR
ncbi:HEAT repeat domain-containing protein [Singulisphaera sp. PoT]|uniref:HEAT repeat domain-containing protein n=1 Tax=Singulisphaera sp. PoT TaxID=3411797 RepID=UPI003BF5ECA9